MKTKAPPGEGIFIRGTAAEVHLPAASAQEMPLARFLELVKETAIRGMDPEALPDLVKWKVECGPLAVYILELKPELRSILWVDPQGPAPLGPEARYKLYRLATPFVVLKIPFIHRKIQPRCELFYRNEPLRKLGDGLFWSNLLNVSPESYGCTAWVCTQYLPGLGGMPGRPSRRGGFLGGLDVFIEHLWGGGFNGSSEAHEGRSCFSKARADKIDPRVTDVERWQAESVKDPGFVLKVAWKPVGLTVEDILRREIESFGLGRDLADAGELISVLLGNGKEG